MTRPTRRAENGSVTVELAILTPVFAALLAFVVLAGRVQAGRADVEAAARAAARILTLSRDTNAAIDIARQQAAATLRVGSPTCTAMTFTPIIGETEVTVEIACVVDLADAGILPIPATMTVSGEATEILDRHREATP